MVGRCFENLGGILLLSKLIEGYTFELLKKYAEQFEHEKARNNFHLIFHDKVDFVKFSQITHTKSCNYLLTTMPLRDKCVSLKRELNAQKLTLCYTFDIQPILEQKNFIMNLNCLYYHLYI